MESEYSYFETLLGRYIATEFPEMKRPEEFIAVRSAVATDCFVESVTSGAHMDAACERACEELFRGLRFSRFGVLRDILLSFFPEVDERDVKHTALQLMRFCRKTFAKYPLSDSFGSDERFADLQTELIGLTTEYLLQNGVQ